MAGLTGEVWLGASDWRLPNRRELRSLLSFQTRRPALPEGVVPEHVCPGYWSSTTSLFGPDWAWALYARDGGIGVGQKGGRHFHVRAVGNGEG